MKKTIEFDPEFVCSRHMTIEVEDGIVTSLSVIGGCNGNLQGIAALVKGMKVEDAIARLEGIKCRGSRTGLTSCPDQFAKALKENI